MSTPEAVRHLEDLARDLDLLVYRLERPATDASVERGRVRRELEGLRDRLQSVVRDLDR